MNIFFLGSTINLIIATFCFFLFYKKRRELFGWFISSLFLTLFVSQHIQQFLEPGSGLIHIWLEIVMLISMGAPLSEISYKYYITYSKKNYNKRKLKLYLVFLFILIISSFIIALFILPFSITFLISICLMVILLSLSFILLIRLYFTSKTILNLFFLIILTVNLFLSFGSFLNLPDDSFHFIVIMQSVLYLSAGIIANIEYELLKSKDGYRKAYNQATFYKDLLSHDISNIMQSILLSNQFIEKNSKIKDNNDVIEFTEIIQDQVKRAKTLILKIKKLSEIKSSINLLEDIEVLYFLNNYITFLKKQNNTKNINVKINSFDQKVFIKANELLKDAIGHILVNAIQHNNNLDVEIIIIISKINKKKKKFIQIEILDNGRGIADNQKLIIFQRENLNEEYLKGIGLGLLYVKKIIDCINGKIWVEDKVKGDYTKGSKFILLIPYQKTIDIKKTNHHQVDELIS
ncbi:MAG: sensor histidine kinase [Candidatus Hermodarchaeota archaeon]